MHLCCQTTNWSCFHIPPFNVQHYKTKRKKYYSIRFLPLPTWQHDTFPAWHLGFTQKREENYHWKIKKKSKIIPEQKKFKIWCGVIYHGVRFMLYCHVCRALALKCEKNPFLIPLSTRRSSNRSATRIKESWLWSDSTSKYELKKSKGRIRERNIFPFPSRTHTLTLLHLQE